MKEDLTNTAYTVMMILSGALFQSLWGWLAVGIYTSVLAGTSITIAVVRGEGYSPDE